MKKYNLASSHFLLFIFILLIFTSLISTSNLNILSLKVTGEHPFYVNNSWVTVDNLKVGDELTMSTGERARISSIKIINEPATVYNLHVDEPNNYFAGNVLVHNKPPNPKPPTSLKVLNFPTQTGNVKVSESVFKLDSNAQTHYLSQLQLVSSTQSHNLYAANLLQDLTTELRSVAPDARVFIGGSVFEGTARRSGSSLSDLDIGFEGVTESQIRSFKNKFNKKMRKHLNNNGIKASNTQFIEHTWIYPGSELPGIPKIESPREFFLRQGIRADGINQGQPFMGQGYLEIGPDELIIVQRL